MNILALDTSFSACSVAVGRAGACAGGARVRAEVVGLLEPMQTGHAERLVPMISEVLAMAGLDVSALDLVAVTHGPGSFTGTRIAVSAARALALASPKIRLVAASSLAVMAEQAARRLVEAGAFAQPPRSDLVIAVDARRGEVYAQRFAWRADGAGVDAAGQPRVLAIEDAAGIGGQKLVDFCGSGADEVARRACEDGREAAAHFPDLLPDARDLARLAVRLEPACGPVEPLYLRPADAKPQAGKSIERAHP